MLGNDFKTKFNRLCNFAIGIAILDGGTIFAIQILDFLLNHFFMQVPQLTGDLQALADVGKANMLISMINILNFSFIIYRVNGIARGIKYPIFICYRQALSRLPALLLLYIGAGITIASVFLQINKILSGALTGFVTANAKLMTFGLLALIPIGIIACIFIVDQNKNPLQAVIATYKYLRDQSNLLILAAIAIMYSLPLALGSLLITPATIPYFGLATTLWLLFCHVLTVVMYIDSAEKLPVKDSDAKKATKVIII